MKLILLFMLFLSLLLLPLTVPTQTVGFIEALVSPTGQVTLREGDRVLCGIQAAMFREGWKWHDLMQSKPGDGGVLQGVIGLEDGKTIRTEAKVVQQGKGLHITYTLTPSDGTAVESVFVSISLPSEDWINVPFQLGESKGVIPEKNAGNSVVTGKAPEFLLGPSPQDHGLVMAVNNLRSEGNFFLQDSRQWGPTFDLRLESDRPGKGAWLWQSGKPIIFEFTVTFNQPVRITMDGPQSYEAGREWLPLKGDFSIEPDSAIDFSKIGWRHQVAGEKGWLRAGPDGTFEFEWEAGKSVRFYGVNFCFGALFPEHGDADQVAQRVRQMGYNSVRIHHYESVDWDEKAGLIDPKAADSLTFKPDALDRFDYLYASFKKQGLYMTTDLYVNRTVKTAEAFGSGEGNVAYRIKTIALISPPGLQNIKDFARKLLEHKNPYTGLAYKDDPALCLLSLINEGAVTNYIGDIRKDDRERLLWEQGYRLWCKDGGGKEEALWESDHFKRYMIETQIKVEKEITRFLREDLKWKGMITDLNAAWPETCGYMVARSNFDYVDNHFYYEHPDFIEKSWQLPSRANGKSAIRQGGEDRSKVSGRFLNKPFTVTEFNYCAPNSFRAEGGFLSGAFAAIQDWSGMWRFAYGHGTKKKPNPVSYFDIADDPLRQATEYAAVALFLRGDAAPAKHTLAIKGSLQDYQERFTESMGDKFGLLGWCFKIGASVGNLKKDDRILEIPLSDRWKDTREIFGLSRKYLPPGNVTDPEKGIFQSDTGEVTVHTTKGIMTVNTPRTVAMAGPQGTRVEKLGPLTVTLVKSWSAVFMTSLDGKELKDSARILLVHATDLKNSGMVFRNRDNTILEKWGETPYLVKAGAATVAFVHDKPGALTVWRLDITGKRVAKIKSRVQQNSLLIDVDNRTQPEPTLYYEIITGK